MTAFIQITPDVRNYLDHEFQYDKYGNLWMVFQTGTSAYVTRMNQSTGEFLLGDEGLTHLVATGLSLVTVVGKGPSLVKRADDSWLVVYNKLDTVERIYQSEPTLDAEGIPIGWTETALTGTDRSRVNVLPCLDHSLAGFRLTYKETSQLNFAWLSESDPTTDNEIKPSGGEASGSSRFSTDGRLVTTVPLAGVREIHVTDTDTGLTTQRTNDGDSKFDPYACYLPSGEYLLMGIVGQVIRVYAPGDPYHTKLIDLAPPDPALPYPQSPEFWKSPSGVVYIPATWKKLDAPVIQSEHSIIYMHTLDGGGFFASDVDEFVRHEGEAYRSGSISRIWYQHVLESGRVAIFTSESAFLPEDLSSGPTWPSIPREITRRTIRDTPW